ncbi:DUF4893 domain-containing protein [Brevundimonas sp.]
MPRLIRSCLSLAVAATALAACATPAPPVPPVPPLPGQTAETTLRDWRGIVTRADRERFDRRDAAWRDALRQARSLSGSGDLASTGALIDPDASIDDVTPPVGNYRCRTVKLGSQGGDEGLGYVVYGWFACRIEDTPNGLKFIKRTGSQRPSGLLFPESDGQMVFLGSMALGTEPGASSYGQALDRDMLGILERIGPARWRLVIPWPTVESKLDLIELVPA